MFRLLFLGNGWTDCVEILYAIGVPLVTAYAVVMGGACAPVRAHVQRYPHTALLYLRNGLTYGLGVIYYCCRQIAWYRNFCDIF